MVISDLIATYRNWVNLKRNHMTQVADNKIRKPKPRPYSGIFGRYKMETP